MKYLIAILAGLVSGVITVEINHHAWYEQGALSARTAQTISDTNNVESLVENDRFKPQEPRPYSPDNTLREHFFKCGAIVGIKAEHERAIAAQEHPGFFTNYSILELADISWIVFTNSANLE